MGNCKYCGKPAGWLSSVHKDCERIHAEGLAELNTNIKDYFTGRIDGKTVCSAIMSLRRNAFITKQDAIMVSRNVIGLFADSLSLSATAKERQFVTNYLATVRLTEQEINEDGTLDRFDNLIAQALLLQSIKNGVIPQSVAKCPVFLSRGESLVYIYNNVTMLQEKVEKEYQGKRNGWSLRVMKGVTYHTGGTKLKPIEHRYMNNEGVGTLYITTQHLVFQSDATALKIPYKKIVGITPYSDGIDVHRDGTNVKRLVFQGFDGSFLMQLLPHVIS